MKKLFLFFILFSTFTVFAQNQQLDLVYQRPSGAVAMLEEIFPRRAHIYRRAKLEFQTHLTQQRPLSVLIRRLANDPRRHEKLRLLTEVLLDFPFQEEVIEELRHYIATHDCSEPVVRAFYQVLAEFYFPDIRAAHLESLLIQLVHKHDEALTLKIIEKVLSLERSLSMDRVMSAIMFQENQLFYQGLARSVFSRPFANRLRHRITQTLNHAGQETLRVMAMFCMGNQHLERRGELISLYNQRANNYSVASLIRLSPLLENNQATGSTCEQVMLKLSE